MPLASHLHASCKLSLNWINKLKEKTVMQVDIRQAWDEERGELTAM